jgi:class 3 adenylate cyclase/sensor domain CHASE-containing protein
MLMRYAPLALIVLLGLGASGGVAYMVDQQARSEARAETQNEFEERVQTAGGLLQRNLRDNLAELYAIRDLYRTVPEVTRARFQSFVERTVAENPVVQAMAWEARVPADAREAFEQRMRAAGFPNYAIRGLDGERLPDGHHEVYFPVAYIEPIDENETALGFDSYDRPSERRAIQEALDRDTVTVSGRIILVQETEDQYGVAGYLPVREFGTDTVQGLAVAVFRVPDLVEGTMQLVRRPFDLVVRDNAAPEGEQYLGHYRRDSGTVRVDTTARAALRDSAAARCPDAETCQFSFEVGQHEWTLQAVPPAGHFRTERSTAALLTLLIGLLLTGGVSTFVYVRQRHLDKVEALAERVQEEKKNAERLLVNILPEAVADELREEGETTPVHHESATVFFADFVNFTVKAERLSADQLVDELDHLFSAFDRIVERHGLEKIKTIGDAYMVAGGVPDSAETHAADCVRAGLEMQAYLRTFNRRRAEADSEAAKPRWEMRIGMCSGPLIAGVIGRMKFTYDVFGDTVVTAKRIEDCGQPGRVNVSAATYERIQDTFVCRMEGEVEAKGKGRVPLYVVEDEPSEKNSTGGA